MKRTLQDYKSIIDPVWCPGCGDYGVLTSLQKALVALEIAPEEIIAVSGIGCSGRLSHYLNAYSLHGTHGRAVPLAVGAKAAAPQHTVLVVGGDGDGLGIGGGHIPHAARKNPDLTYLLIDNRVYGLTKGQSSPTTPLGTATKTSPFGVVEGPLAALPVFLAYDVSFLARGVSTQPRQLTEIIEQAISHRGMSIVYILSPCRTFPVLDTKGMKEIFRPLPDDYDSSDKMQAMAAAYSEDPLYCGIFYQVQKPTLDEQLEEGIEHALQGREGKGPMTVEEVLQGFV